MEYVKFIFFSLLIARSRPENVRTLSLRSIVGMKYECLSLGCSVSTTLLASSLMRCAAFCSSDSQCRTLVFNPSNQQCQLYPDIPSQFGSLTAEIDFITMTANDGRILSAPTSTTTTTTTTTTTSTTTTETTTTTISTTTPTLFPTGVQTYSVELTGNGYHGVQRIRYYSATNYGTWIRFDYPIVYLSGTIFSGSYGNNAWYGLHGACGEAAGVATCTAICKALGKSYYGIVQNCGTGYTGTVTAFVNPDRAVYTATDSTGSPWNDYGTASGCQNPMYFCDCTL